MTFNFEVSINNASPDILYYTIIINTQNSVNFCTTARMSRKRV